MPFLMIFRIGTRMGLADIFLDPRLTLKICSLNFLILNLMTGTDKWVKVAPLDF